MTTSLNLQEVTAVISLGNLVFTTPGRLEPSAGHISSFSIDRSRNQNIAQLKFRVYAWINAGNEAFKETPVNNLGDRVTVQAGVGTDIAGLPTLFTGYVTGISKRPHWEDSRKVILEIAAEDVFARMRVGGKISRRFKMGDEAFAIITGGTRRDSGTMSQLKRVQPGQSGIAFINAESSRGDHSPLIRTPDPQGLSPFGSRVSRGGTNTGASTGETSLQSSPQSVYMSAGDVQLWQIIDKATGLPINVVNYAQQVSGKGCCVHSSPSVTSFTSGVGGGGSGVPIGSAGSAATTFPVSVQSGSTLDAAAQVFTVKMTGSYPTRLTFVHPFTGATATLEINIIPPHSHRDISQGGPAVGSWDAFQL